MKIPKANIQSQMTQKLIHLLSELETTNRQCMNSDGKKYLDDIWKLLGQPSYDELRAAQETARDKAGIPQHIIDNYDDVTPEDIKNMHKEEE